MSIIRNKTNKVFDDYASGKISLYKFAERIFEIGDYSVRSARNAGIFYDEVNKIKRRKK